jgi:hypothetical protein
MVLVPCPARTFAAFARSQPQQREYSNTPRAARTASLFALTQVSCPGSLQLCRHKSVKHTMTHV